MFITAVCVIFFIKLRWLKNKSLYETEYISEIAYCGAIFHLNEIDVHESCSWSGST